MAASIFNDIFMSGLATRGVWEGDMIELGGDVDSQVSDTARVVLVVLEEMLVECGLDDETEMVTPVMQALKAVIDKVRAGVDLDEMNELNSIWYVITEGLDSTYTRLLSVIGRQFKGRLNQVI